MEGVCSFFGHRRIFISDNFIIYVQNIIEDLIINENITTFIFGRYGEFDCFCKKIVDDLKKKYPYIKTTLAMAYYVHKKQNCEYLENYDNSILMNVQNKPFRTRIIYRNRKIVDISKFILFYVEKDYGGAYQTLQYAKKTKNKEAIVNISEASRY